MVDIISISDAVCKTVHIVNACKNIINNNMLRNEVVTSAGNFLFEFLIAVTFAENLIQNSKTYTLFDVALCFCVKVNKLRNINHCVGYNLDNLALNMLNKSDIYTCVLNFSCKCRRNNLTYLSHNLACKRICNRLCNLLISDSVCYAELFVIFITANSRHIISSWVEEKRIDMCLCTFYCRRLTRTKLSINLFKSFLGVFAGILFYRCKDSLVSTEIIYNICVGAKT